MALKSGISGLLLASLLGISSLLLASFLTAGCAHSASPLQLSAKVTAASPDNQTWSSLAFLIGKWQGTSGPTKGSFSLQPDLQNHILIRRNRNDLPGHHHEDLMVIYHRPDKSLRAIYFDNENHVIHYNIITSDSPRQAVFLSDPIPGASRFRLTYTLNPDQSLHIEFAIQPPGASDFKLYTGGTVRRM